MHIELIERKNIKIAVFDSPHDDNHEFYKDFLESNNICNIIRLCKVDYSEKKFKKIKFTELNYQDGYQPSNEVLVEFENYIKTIHDSNDKKINIGIHCRAGFGRSSTLAAYVLVKYDKMDPIDAITMIRDKIPRAFNTTQLNYVMSLKPENKLSKKKFFGLF